jgi:hypothetical protein
MTFLMKACFCIPAFHDLIDSRDHVHEPSVSIDVDNVVYERLEKEAKKREELELGCPVDKTSVPSLDHPTPPDAKKRGLSQLDGDDKVGESPPKLLKMSSDPEDNMDVEGAVCQAVRDFMDLDCGDAPRLEMQECTCDTCDQSLGAEHNVILPIPTHHTHSSNACLLTRRLSVHVYFSLKQLPWSMVRNKFEEYSQIFLFDFSNFN